MQYLLHLRSVLVNQTLSARTVGLLGGALAGLALALTGITLYSCVKIFSLFFSLKKITKTKSSVNWSLAQKKYVWIEINVFRILFPICNTHSMFQAKLAPGFVCHATSRMTLTCPPPSIPVQVPVPFSRPPTSSRGGWVGEQALQCSVWLKQNWNMIWVYFRSKCDQSATVWPHKILQRLGKIWVFERKNSPFIKFFSFLGPYCIFCMFWTILFAQNF